MRARAAGVSRAAGHVLIDATLLLVPGQPPRPAADGAGHPAGTAQTAQPAHAVRAVPGGWEITGPDGRRLLAAAGPDAVPEPPDDSAPFDLVLLDLLTSPAQLGQLRARGLVHSGTTVAALYADHRVSSEQELARRCAVWGVTAGRDGELLNPDVPPTAGDAAGSARPHRTLIIGGARSGKSREAELRLAGEPSVTYVAAGPWTDAEAAAADPEWTARVAAHRAARPAWWRTRETLDVAGVLRTERGALLIDGIGTWLAAVMEQAGAWQDPAAQDPASPDPSARLAAMADELVQAWRQTSALVVAVTDQVGEGLVPAYPAGRVFRDQLGWLNQRLAAESDLVLQVVAGRVAPLPA